MASISLSESACEFILQFMASVSVNKFKVRQKIVFEGDWHDIVHVVFLLLAAPRVFSSNLAHGIFVDFFFGGGLIL